MRIEARRLRRFTPFFRRPVPAVRFYCEMTTYTDGGLLAFEVRAYSWAY